MHTSFFTVYESRTSSSTFAKIDFDNSYCKFIQISELEGIDKNIFIVQDIADHYGFRIAGCKDSYKAAQTIIRIKILRHKRARVCF